MKQVLILCTGNSCRSIIAEGLVNRFLNIKAFSAGSNPKKEVNKNAIKVLKEINAWNNYYPKSIEEVMDKDYDLVVTVCNNAKEACPVFPKKTELIHIPFEDPDGKDIEEFRKLREEMKNTLLPKIEEILKGN